ncbi:unnamed protein product [Adineta steineri]|uniref:Uncharacterized protein n=1 Tax=Adineta steineri TaxID=433720 RepID=A0A814E7R1_9BILA|nr:unnamed protein product [Adineta steineri]
MKNCKCICRAEVTLVAEFKLRQTNIAEVKLRQENFVEVTNIELNLSLSILNHINHLKMKFSFSAAPSPSPPVPAPPLLLSARAGFLAGTGVLLLSGESFGTLLAAASD